MADRLLDHRVSCLVVDPVLVSTSGHSLGNSEVARALVDRSNLSSYLVPFLSLQTDLVLATLFCNIASSSLHCTLTILVTARVCSMTIHGNTDLM